MTLNSAALAALALIAGLFAIATLVEARSTALRRSRRLRHFAYTMALGVYCSSWTFYGAVGSAVRDGWLFLPIYLAPILLLVLGPRFLNRLSQAVAEERAATVSDFIAARFGHDVVIALLGTIPYVALQLRSIGVALSIVSGSSVLVPGMVGAAVLLALFALLFGARKFEIAARSEGMLYAIGVESLLKIGALGAVGATAVFMLAKASPAEIAHGVAIMEERFRPEGLTIEFAVVGLISAMAIIVLPRQFFMAIVEAQRSDDLARARFGLAAYLGAMAMVVIPIALAGTAMLGKDVPPDLYVLQLPAAGNHGIIVVAALLGGISAAAAMVIVDATAMATMVSNDLFFPTVLRSAAADQSGAIGRRMLAVRRGSIVGIIGLALVWGLLLSARESLASIGLVAFAAMAQFTPHLILAVNGRDRAPIAARASLAVGLVLWLYTLALPPILPLAWREALAGTPLDPLRLLGIGKATPLVHGVFWSLGANVAVLAFAMA